VSEAQAISAVITHPTHRQQTLRLHQLLRLLESFLSNLHKEEPIMASKRPQLSQKRKLADLEAELTAAARTSPSEGQGFVVEFFLDEQKLPRLTQVLHVKSGEGEQWPGWDEHRLLEFMTQRVGVKPIRAMKTPVATVRTEPTAISFDLKEMEISAGMTGSATRLLKNGDPFSITLSFILPEEAKAERRNFDYQFYLSAQNTEDQAQRLLALEQGSMTKQQNSLTVKVNDPHLPPGTYQFQASMFVADAAQLPAQQFKHASVSRIYQVY
jgi:hypothetical protein